MPRIHKVPLLCSLRGIRGGPCPEGSAWPNSCLHPAPSSDPVILAKTSHRQQDPRLRKAPQPAPYAARQNWEGGVGAAWQESPHAFLSKYRSQLEARTDEPSLNAVWSSAWHVDAIPHTTSHPEPACLQLFSPESVHPRGWGGRDTRAGSHGACSHMVLFDSIFAMLRNSFPGSCPSPPCSSIFGPTHAEHRISLGILMYTP